MKVQIVKEGQMFYRLLFIILLFAVVGCHVPSPEFSITTMWQPQCQDDCGKIVDACCVGLKPPTPFDLSSLKMGLIYVHTEKGTFFALNFMHKSRNPISLEGAAVSIDGNTFNCVTRDTSSKTKDKSGDTIEEMQVEVPEQFFKSLSSTKLVTVTLRGKSGAIEKQINRKEVEKMLQFYSAALSKKANSQKANYEDLCKDYSSTLESSQTSEIELTETDITTIRNFKSSIVKVFDVSLGMTREEAECILRKNKGLKIKQDVFIATRFYVYDLKPDGSENKCILYYRWEPNDKRLESIIIYSDFVNYLKGNTKLLLTPDVLDNQSEIAKSFLGSPVRSKITLDIPKIDAKDITYFYEDKGLQIIRHHYKDRDSIMLSLYRVE